MNGNYRAFSIPVLSANGLCHESLEQKAYFLAKHFPRVSSSEYSSAAFVKHNTQAALPSIRTSGGAIEFYNSLLTVSELECALHKIKPTAARPIGIHFDMLTHLYPSTLDIVLYLFNHILRKSTFPSSCRVATNIPLMTEKYASCTSSYLTSCLSKALEGVPHKRLMHFFQK